MSLTLGEKLRQAREEHGFSISEVAEHTRISALYIESIENNDYRTLPGGIFNKGFVKSYAKHVGINEQEALQEYAALIAQQGSDVNDDPKTYRPEVLTDERSRSGLLPTLIFSAIIVGLIVWGVMAFLQYYSNSSGEAIANTNANNAVANNAPATPVPTPPVQTDQINVELRALTGPLSLIAVSDGKKSYPLINPNKPAVFEPKQSVYLSYSREQGANAQLMVNGKQINPPPPPPAKGNITFEINKNNIAQILQSGTVPTPTPNAPR